LIAAFVAGSFTLIVRARRRAAGDGASAGLLAAAAGGFAAFAITAGIDWAWELPALPISALLIVGAALGPERVPSPARHPSRRLRLAVLAAVGLAAIVPSLAGLSFLRDSQSEFRAGDLDAALYDVHVARAIEPYSGAAALQEAIVLETIGDLRGGVASARAATEKEPTNWANWFLLSRFERILGEHPGASEEAHEKAVELNPHSLLFTDEAP
jgi:hypothetical protein